MDDKFKELEKKRKVFRHVFGTNEGKQVLDAMAREFNGLDLMAPTSEQTAYNLGRRDVVMYIYQMIQENETNE